MKKPRMSTAEKNAREFFAKMDKEAGFGVYVVETPSRTWGYTAKVETAAGVRISDIASGCGYCKCSTALGDTLGYLFEPPERYDITKHCGAGVDSVRRAMAEKGWECQTTHHRNSTYYYFTRSNP